MINGFSAVATVIDHAPFHWTPGMRITAIAVAKHVGIGGECWPSFTTISAMTGLSRRQVIRYMQQLEDEGVILKNRRGGSSNLYTWVWISEPSNRSGDVTHVTSSSDTHDTPLVTPMSPR